MPHLWKKVKTQIEEQKVVVFTLQGLFLPPHRFFSRVETKECEGARGKVGVGTKVEGEGFYKDGE